MKTQNLLAKDLRRKRLPDFLVMGASRSGTSSLFKNLCRHPKIEGHENKEIHFFNNDEKYSDLGMKWYIDQFPKINDDTLCFEATPAYFHLPEKCAPRIFKHLPGCKFITLLRNPADRAISRYQRWQDTDELWKPRELMEEIHRVFYLETGIYVNLFRKWFEYYSRDRFLILKAEEFFKDEKKTFAQCYDWLGVESLDMGEPLFFDQKRRRCEKLPYQHKMPSIVKEYLEDFFQSYNQELYEFLGRDFGW